MVYVSAVVDQIVVVQMSSETTTTLTSWVQTLLTALYESSSTTQPSEFQSSFDAVFSSGAQFFVNYEPVARDAFKEDMEKRAFAATRISVEWKEVMEVAKADNNAHGIGTVAGCIVITRSMKFRIRAAPAQSNTNIVFIAKVERDPTIQSGDPRRIVHIHQASVDKAAPIHLHGGNDGSLTGTA